MFGFLVSMEKSGLSCDVASPSVIFTPQAHDLHFVAVSSGTRFVLSFSVSICGSEVPRQFGQPSVCCLGM